MKAINQAACRGCADKLEDRYLVREVTGSGRPRQCPLCGGYYQDVPLYEMWNRKELEKEKSRQKRKAEPWRKKDTRARYREPWRDRENTEADN